MSDQGEENTANQGKPSELHEIIERRLLAPYRVALLLDNGSLVLMSSNTGAQMTMDAAEANSLLDLLYAHRDLLYQQTHQEEGGAS